MEGQDLSARSEIWEELAVTEMRLQLMSKLIQIKVGFADVEEFNLGLKGNLKNPENVSPIHGQKLTQIPLSKTGAASPLGIISRKIQPHTTQTIQKLLTFNRPTFWILTAPKFSK